MEWDTGTTPNTQRLIDCIDQYHIRKNPAPEGIFSYGIGTISIYCTQVDHPGGAWTRYEWGRTSLGSFTKDANRVGHAHFLFSQAIQEIIGFTYATRALALSSQNLLPRDVIMNRAEDLVWVEQKLVWLWQQAFPENGLPQLMLEPDQPINTEDVADFIVYHAYGPGRLTSVVEQAIKACGSGWHRLEALARHLPNGKLTDEHCSALWSMIQDGKVLARPTHDWPQIGTTQEFCIPNGN